MEKLITDITELDFNKLLILIKINEAIQANDLHEYKIIGYSTQLNNFIIKSNESMCVYDEEHNMFISIFRVKNKFLPLHYLLRHIQCDLNEYAPKFDQSVFNLLNMKLVPLDECGEKSDINDLKHALKDVALNAFSKEELITDHPVIRLNEHSNFIIDLQSEELPFILDKHRFGNTYDELRGKAKKHRYLFIYERMYHYVSDFRLTQDIKSVKQARHFFHTITRSKLPVPGAKHIAFKMRHELCAANCGRVYIKTAHKLDKEQIKLLNKHITDMHTNDEQIFKKVFNEQPFRYNTYNNKPIEFDLQQPFDFKMVN